ncbi:unnamed protein product [Sphagnum troendelagicum]|uniref:Uncharacterized protein n=1 Tax=Sphagnum troendelagicum TaxID=128251 RepID=A0ABP0TG16_9BRYO
MACCGVGRSSDLARWHVLTTSLVVSRRDLLLQQRRLLVSERPSSSYCCLLSSSSLSFQRLGRFSGFCEPLSAKKQLVNLAAAAQERLAENVVNGSVTGNSDHDDDCRVFGALALHRSTEGGEDEVLPRLAVDHEESNEFYNKLLENSLNKGSASSVEDYGESEDEECAEDRTTGQAALIQAARASQHANKFQVADNKLQDRLEKWQEVDVKSSDALLELLRNEAIQSSNSLKLATQAMVAARKKIDSLQKQLDMTGTSSQQEQEFIRNKDALSLGESLTLLEAGDKIKELEKQLESGKLALQEEKKITAPAMHSAAKWEQALQLAELKIEELVLETVSLKGLVESKDKTVQAIREETRRNANMLLAAAKTRDALASVEKKVELLTVQVATLEEELQSRDVLLEEVKDEMVHSTDALKVAAEIKQDLNASKRREVELSQELETQKELVKELQLEVAENIRAVRAEQALRQTEKKLNDTQMEVEVLRKGVQARDEALHFMKDEVDRSVDILSHAAETREELQKMKGYIKELRAELKSKDTKLASLHEELVVARSSARYQDPDPTTPSPCVPSPSNTEMPKLKGKLNWRKHGNTQRSSEQL